MKWSAVESSRLRSYLLSAPLREERLHQHEPLGERQLQERLGHLARQWRGQAPVWPKRVTVNLQGSGVMCGYLEFPHLIDREIETALPAAVARDVPFPPESMFIAHHRVPCLGQAAGSAIFYTAMQRSKVALLQKLALAAGLEAFHLEPACLALTREYSKNHGESPDRFVALVHCGYRWTQVVILRAGHCYYARDFTLAGGDFTQALQRAHQLDWATAERKKLQLDVQEDRSSPVEPCLRRWLERVRLHLYNFHERTRHEVGQVFLSGGSAAWRGLDARLAELVDIPVVCDDWESIRAPADCKGNAVVYKVALGVALKGA